MDSSHAFGSPPSRPSWKKKREDSDTCIGSKEPKRKEYVMCPCVSSC